jgi:hypothetical protein
VSLGRIPVFQQVARPQKTQIQKSSIVAAACVLLALLTAVYPVTRAFFRVEVDYNEGWNIFNAQRLVNHLPLYPVAYGWETVNYPMLWFALLAWLHHVTNDYLFTARLISLVALAGCCTLVGAIVRHLSGSRRAAILSGFLCLGLFCTNANEYVGMDDPQLLADFFFLLAFYLFLRTRRSYAAVAGVAALFVLAGNIKHNPIDFPLAILIDLAILSWRRALWFAVCGIALAAASVVLNTHFGGPYFVTEMLAPRSYSFEKLGDYVIAGLGPLLIPSLAAIVAAVLFLRNPSRRVASILCLASLVVGSLFAGGIGVSVNTFFSFMFSIAIMFGLVVADLDLGRWAWASKRLFDIPLRIYAVPIFFAWLVIPAMVAKVANPIWDLEDTAAAQRRFDHEVAILRDKPGPVVCESLLRCYFAGKPYVYDPFNATRLIDLHKLDPTPVLQALRSGAISAVQLDQSPDIRTETERFPSPMIAAIRQNYQPAHTDEDVVIYVPKPTPFPQPAKLAAQSVSFSPSK